MQGISITIRDFNGEYTVISNSYDNKDDIDEYIRLIRAALSLVTFPQELVNEYIPDVH